jgi:hypothetical protein
MTCYRWAASVEGKDRGIEIVRRICPRLSRDDQRTTMSCQTIVPALRSQLSHQSQRRWILERSLRVTLAASSSGCSSPHQLALPRRAFTSSSALRADASAKKSKQPYNAVKEAEERLTKQGKQQSMTGLSMEMQGLPLQGWDGLLRTFSR